MQKLIIMLMVSLPLLLQVSEARSEDERPIISVRAEVWPKFSHKDGGGYFFELLKAVYEPLGYQLVYKTCPWKRCIREVVESRADVVIGLYENEWGEGQQLNKPKYPVFFDRVFAMYKKSLNIEWHGQETLRNQSIVQSRGFDFHFELDVPVKNHEVSTATMAWRFMAAGRAKFFVSTREEIRSVMADAEHRSVANDYELKQVFQRNVYLGYPQTSKGDELLRVAEQRLPQLYRDGTVQNLLDKWQLNWLFELDEQGELR